MGLIGSVCCGLGGRLIGRGSEGVSKTAGGISSMLAVWGMYDIGIVGNRVKIDIGSWIEVGSIAWRWELRYDSLSMLMVLLVCVVSWGVQVYSCEYMAEDESRSRFLCYMGLFSVCMVLLVVGNNYGVMFVGWEGIGVCSYMLISYWNKRIEGNKAGIQAMVANRVGDLGMVIGIGLYQGERGGIDYELMSGVSVWNNGIGGMMLIGAIGKSAQLGLHVWLPYAMEASTPVSALLHAATLVTSGVYIMVRSSWIMDGSSLGSVVAIVGGATAIVAGLIGVCQNDMKRVIAYSTGSQLGYMMMCCGMGSNEVSMYHLINHGCFKAILFLGAGSVIHGLYDEQDMRRMGGMRKVMPVSYSVMCIGTMGLAGVPYMSGSYSKERIIELGGVSGVGLYYVMGSVGAMLTGVYGGRVIREVYLKESRQSRGVMEHASESGWRMKGSMLIGSIGGVWSGYVLEEMLVGIGSDFWGGSVSVGMDQRRVEAEELSIVWKGVALCMGMTGIGIGLGCDVSGVGSRWYKIGNRKMYIDKVYGDVIIQGVMSVGYSTYSEVDRGVVSNVGSVSYWEWSKGRGEVYEYGVIMLVGTGVVLGCWS